MKADKTYYQDLRERAAERFRQIERLQEQGLICKQGDFVPSVHYPPITRYPDVTEDFILKDYTMPEDGMMDIYVHFPFCAQRCLFCHYPGKVGPQEEEKENVRLPETFEGRRLSYRSLDSSGNEILLFMGPLAVAVLVLKDKNDEKLRRKKWEDGLLADYPDLVSGFLVLTGAGYPVRQAWKKQVQDYKRAPKKGYHPVYEEMEITLNQMETGMPEVRAYGEFGKRTGLRCYVRLVSLLESGVPREEFDIVPFPVNCPELLRQRNFRVRVAVKLVDLVVRVPGGERFDVKHPSAVLEEHAARRVGAKLKNFLYGVA